MDNQQLPNTPKRPLAHATLSGSFVLISTLGCLALVVSITSSGFGWLEGGRVISKTPATTADKKWKTEEKTNPPRNLRPHQQSLAATQRPFSEAFLAGIRSLMKETDAHPLSVAHQYMRFESHYSDDTKAAGDRRVRVAQDWLTAEVVKLSERPIEQGLRSLQSGLLGSDEILYNKYSNLAIKVPESQRLQCQTASVALALATLMQPLPARLKPVFVLSPGHVQFGVLNGDTLYAVESTGTESKVLVTPLKALKHRMVTDARLHLLESMAMASGLASEWDKSPLKSQLVLYQHPGKLNEPSTHGRWLRPAQGPFLSRGLPGGAKIPEGDLPRAVTDAPQTAGVVTSEAFGVRDRSMKVSVDTRPSKQASPNGEAGGAVTLGSAGVIGAKSLGTVRRHHQTEDRLELEVAVPQGSDTNKTLYVTRTKVGPVNVDHGGVKASDVLTAAKVHHDGLWRCFFAVPLVKGDGTNWDLDLQLQISANGSVREVMVTSDSMTNAEARRCAKTLFKKTVFPKFEAGVARVALPLRLESPWVTTDR